MQSQNLLIFTYFIIGISGVVIGAGVVGLVMLYMHTKRWIADVDRRVTERLSTLKIEVVQPKD